MATDPWQHPSAKLFVKQVLADMEPKLADSAIAISLVPGEDEDREGDVKYWVELGASIMMDKPIIAVILGRRTLPRKLALVADEVVRCPDGLNEAAGLKITKAIERMVRKHGPR